ncbi:oligosaccharide flippase family protein [Paenibacillus sp. sgz302251]|uniref:polysaccharide biosynthesis protein n=1 Tax=Paenibacillus sp. sgz302251 TaxID=3414493 RepID=UPI003C7DA62A
MEREPDRMRHAAETLVQANGKREAEAAKVRLHKSRMLFNGVALMAGAALLSKVIGVFQKIPLQNMAGDRVFGIYNAVYPLYQMAAILATAGLPTAVSLLIAERLRQGGSTEGVRHILYAALLLLGISGVIAFGWMWAGADRVASWIGDAETASAIRALSAALLFAPFVAALRGYVQGLGRMALSAVSQIVEQLIRVAVMLMVLALSWSAGWSDASVAAGVMSGSAAGAIAALLVLGAVSWKNKRRERLSPVHAAIGAEMKRLAVVALPAALGAVVVPALGVVDAFTVPRLLRDGGLAESEAMGMFGIYSRAQPLVQLVVMVAGAAAAALVPGLALARIRGAYGQLRMQLSVAERAAWAVGAAASMGLVLLAEPINVMLYADSSGTTAFALVGCAALAGCVNAVTAPVLQGLGAVRAPAVLLLIAALLKGALNALFVPLYGIEGAAIAGIASLSVIALLGSIAVRYAATAAGASLGWSARVGEQGRVMVDERPVVQRGETARRERSVSGEERIEGSERSERAYGAGSDQADHKRADEGERSVSGEERIARSQRRGRATGAGRRRGPSLGRAAAGMGFALAVMAAAIVVAERALSAALGGLPPRAAAAALALTCIAVGACAFGAAALRGGAVSARELRALPGGGVLAARLRRWRLIPPAEEER